MSLPQVLEDLVMKLTLLPGVGKKTAFRYALGMLKWPDKTRQEFIAACQGLDLVRYCDECGMISDAALCGPCNDPIRTDAAKLLVVEGVADCLAIENCGGHGGVYHLLGGLINPLLGIGPDELTIDKLLLRIRKLQIKDVVLALNPSVEGDVTCSYIADKLADESVRVQRIGLGIPMGGNIEYLDGLTISKAIENAQMF